MLVVYVADDRAAVPTTAVERQPGRYMRKREAARYLGVAERTLTNFMQRRMVPYAKLGRVCLFDRDELERAVRRYRVNAVGE